MNSEIKARWVNALRSGEYEQGYGALRNSDNTHCCLGVLCDTVDPRGWDLDNHHNGEADFPHSHILQAVGIPLSAGNWTLPENIAALSDMNDSKDKTFSDIADWIEVNL